MFVASHLTGVPIGSAADDLAKDNAGLEGNSISLENVRYW